MKQFYYVLFLIIFLPYLVSAQGKYKRIGIETGLLAVDGDVDSKITGGGSIGISYYQEIHRDFNIEVNYLYGETSGLDPQIYGHNPYTDTPWFPSNKLNLHNAYIALGIKTKILSKLEIGFQYGIGLLAFNNRMNALNESGIPYPDIKERVGSGRIVDLKLLKEILDDTYETQGIIDRELFSIRNYSFQLSHNFSSTVNYPISPRWTLGLKTGILIANTDSLDGITHRTFLDPTNNVDIVQRISLSIMRTIGTSK